jgi:hypothetical protein
MLLNQEFFLYFLESFQDIVNALCHAAENEKGQDKKNGQSPQISV